MPGESVVKKSEIARELNFVTKGTLVVTDANDVLIQLVTGEGTAPSIVGEVSFLMGASLVVGLEFQGNAEGVKKYIGKSAVSVGSWMQYHKRHILE